jgi:hypothetical protein
LRGLAGSGTLGAMGFEFRETMAGGFRLHDRPDEERPLSFTIRARSPRLGRFVRSPVVEVEGEFDAEGFADHQPLRGTLGLDLLRSGTLPYALRFPGNDGARYRFVGKKVASLLHPVASMTDLPGVLLDEEGREIGQSFVRFDARHDLLRFLASWHLI